MEAPSAALLDIDPLDLLRGTVAGQVQLAGQLNLNSQEGLAIASATSDYVDVRSEEDPSTGDGITATSSAVAAATLTQTANQANDEQCHRYSSTGAGGALSANNHASSGASSPSKDELVIQANINEQEGAAVADATSGPVTVDESFQRSGGDGVTATSSAVAAATLTQTADQSNSDSKLVERAVGPAPGEGETTVQPFAEVSGRNRDPGECQRRKTVLQLRKRPLTRSPSGARESCRLAAMASRQRPQRSPWRTSANRRRRTTTTASLQKARLLVADRYRTRRFRRRRPEPVGHPSNINEQEGAVVASATSGSVFVDQNGYVSAGGDGITPRLRR